MDCRLRWREAARKATSPDQRLLAAIDRGDMMQVDKALQVISRDTDNLDIRDYGGLNTYSYAINAGFAPVITQLLSYHVPLGDALLRACAVSFEDAAKIIIKYAKRQPEKEKRVILECNSDNDDFHPAMTPLKMAAIRNNFVIVQLLLKAGTQRLVEPSLEGLADATLSDVVRNLDIYRALASPAYLGLAHSNALSNAFKLCGRLRKIAGVWEAVNAEFYELAHQTERFAASLLDFVANSHELGTLFRQSDRAESVSAVSQVQTAVNYDQKAFVAHSYTQTILSINFYRHLDVKSTMFSFLSLLSMFGYPLICLAYILVQHPRLNDFLAVPHIKLCTHFGSDLALFACYAAGCLTNDRRVIQVVTIILVIFCCGICWKHMCDIFHYGVRDFCSYGPNILDAFIVILTFSLVTCHWIGYLQNSYVTRVRQRHNEKVSMVTNTNVTSVVPDVETTNERIDDFVLSEWNDPIVVLNSLVGVVVILTVIRAFNTAIKSYHDMFALWESTAGAFRLIITFLILYAIYLLAFAVGVYGLYAPQARLDISECNGMMECGLAEDDYRSIQISLLTLWWTFNGDGNSPVVANPPTVVNTLHIILVAMYFIAVLILVNTLIAMLGSRFSTVEKNSDIEWKFGRTKMWLRFIRSDVALPPPFNLIPTTGSIIRLIRNWFCCCFNCTKTQKDIPKGTTTTDDANPRKVLNEILKRYITSKIEKTDDDNQGESIGIDDLRQLKQDIITVKFNLQTDIQVIHKMIEAIWEIIRNIKLKFPTMEAIESRIPETRTEIAEMFRLAYPSLDEGIYSVDEIREDIEWALAYVQPKVVDEPLIVPHEVASDQILMPTRVAEEFVEPEVMQPVVIAPQGSPLTEIPEEHDVLSRSPTENAQYVDVIEEEVAENKKPLVKTVKAKAPPKSRFESINPPHRRSQGNSLTRKMANMFESGRTVDVDEEVTEEIRIYRRQYTNN